MERIGKYEIQGEIGQGSMGKVYRALDPMIRRVVAIKVIRTSELEDQEQRAWMHGRFYREARAAGMLSHANIITVFDVGDQDDIAYIAMEYVGGPSLEEILERPGPVDQTLILGILRQAASALDHAHRRGVIHRDIKPSNIMLTEEGVAKIADFGIAKDLTGKDLTQERTKAGMVLGTPFYMSPEQIQGKAVDGRSDQFALAAVAYRSLTGQKPFEAESLTVLLYKILFEEIKPPAAWNPKLPPAMTPVLNKALAKSREGRYATCTEFVQALEESLDSGTKAAATPAPASRFHMPAALDREKKYFYLALAAAFVVVMLGAWFLHRSSAQRRAGPRQVQRAPAVVAPKAVPQTPAAVEPVPEPPKVKKAVRSQQPRTVPVREVEPPPPAPAPEPKMELIDKPAAPTKLRKRP